MSKIVFPEDFMFGAATSSTQIEGGVLEDGRGLSIWDTFARVPGAIIDNTTPDICCESYHRWREDLHHIKEMGLQSYRFSFSWSRILPEGMGKVNQQGLDYYKRMIDEMQRLKIVPNATIYHWDLPYELERRGGWLNRDIVEWYGEYASLLYREFHDSIPLWTTVNEPIAVYVGYADGRFAPGKIGEQFGRQANHHLLLAHGEGVRRFRQEKMNDSKIGIVVDIWHHQPLRPDNNDDNKIAELENEKTYRSYLTPILKGKYSEALIAYMEQEKCMPVMQDKDLEKISQPLDFFGLNCYNRVIDCADAQLLGGIKHLNVGGNYMDNGNEYYPKAIYDAIHILKDEYQLNIPIYITENGVNNCEEDITAEGKIDDIQRITYIKGFLKWVHKAIREGINIRGYYVWSLMDNWEWSAGYTFRFGLIHTDFETQERIWKESAYWYKKVIQERGICDP